jgi:1-acyl-sn-glycerol-3-phosphate acyltransferase
MSLFSRFDPLGSIRVGTRLVRMAASVTLIVQRLRWRARLRGDCPHTAVRHGHVWARRTLRALGVELEVSGTAPQERVLLLANHRSYLDIPVLLSQLPCSFLAKAEIGSWPLFGAAARLVHTVFVQREDPASRRAARQGALERLQRGLSFAAFPEGTTSRGPGTLPFFPGLFRLAEEHGIPVVPVAIEYEDANDAWVDDDPFLGHFLSCFQKPRVRVSLAFGPILRAEHVEDLKAEAERWIAARLAAGRSATPSLSLGPVGRPQPSVA